LTRYEEAVELCDKALAIEPELADAHCNRGMALDALDRPNEAIAAYERALSLNPAHAQAGMNKAVACLSVGRFAEGWELFENRWRAVANNVPRPYPQPRWDGRPVRGTLLVWGEQGLGDQIIYAGMVPALSRRADAVVLEVEPRLVPLFRRSFPGVT